MKLLISLLCAGLALAQTAKYPGAIATDADLLKWKDRSASTLTAGIDASTLSVPVVDGTKFVAYEVITIDDEQMQVCNIVANTLTICTGTRGWDWTVPATHALGAAVRGQYTAWHHNSLAEEIKAIETALGVNLANVALASHAHAGSDITSGTVAEARIDAALARDSEINVQGTANEIASTGGGVAPVLSIPPTFDISGKTSTKPVKAGTTAPGTCAVGELFYDTDATAGQNLYGCTAVNTWTLLGDGGGGGDHNLLSATHPDTTVASVTRGGLMVGQGATPKWELLALGTVNYCLKSDGTDAVWATCGTGTGDVVGPASATDHAIARFDTTTGKLLQDSLIPVSDTGGITLPEKFTTTPSANQPITATSDVILCNAATVQVTPSSSLQLESTPTIADGANGQVCRIVNLSTTNTLAIQDESIKTGSNLRLNTDKVVIYQRASIELIFNSTVGDWVIAAHPDPCALPDQTGNAGEILKTDGSTASWTPFLTLPPSSAQTIDAATDSILAEALNVRIAPDADYTLTSAPTIADGSDGQLLLISNNTTFSVTVQDESILANSNLRLGGSNITIGPRGSLLLSYNTALASWVRADTPATGTPASQFTYTFFDTATDLPNTLDIPSIYPNRARAITLTEVWCEADVADGAVINLQRDDGTPANILSADLTCTTAGATSTAFVAGENSIAVGHNVDHVTVSVLATLRRVNIAVRFTVD